MIFRGDETGVDSPFEERMEEIDIDEARLDLELVFESVGDFAVVVVVDCELPDVETCRRIEVVLPILRCEDKLPSTPPLFGDDSERACACTRFCGGGSLALV